MNSTLNKASVKDQGKATRESLPGRSRNKHEQMCRYKDSLGKLGESRFHFESGQPEMKKELWKMKGPLIK